MKMRYSSVVDSVSPPEEIQLSKSRDSGRGSNSVTLITRGFVAAEMKSHKSFVWYSMPTVRLDFIHRNAASYEYVVFLVLTLFRVVQLVKKSRAFLSENSLVQRFVTVFVPWTPTRFW